MREITDSVMRMKIINHIKSLLNDSDDYVKEKAQNGLKYLILNSDEVKLLIYSKNPYPGLIRLLEHTNSKIVSDAIISIILLLQAGSSTTKESDTHPHFESFLACDGLKKIFALFQKNVSKYSRDRSAFCIGFLFKAQEITDPVMRQEIINHLKSLLYVNRCEILNETELIKIEQDLKLPTKGIKEYHKNILQKQETDLLLLSSVIVGREDNELRKRIISSGIVESLLLIFTKRDLNSITRTYSQTFFHITNNLNDEVKLLIYNKNPYPGLIRLLEHTNSKIVSDAIISIILLLQAGSSTTKESDTHPHFESFLACDGLKKIFALFQKNVSKYSRDRSALCIVYLFKAREITDPLMRNEIANHIKSLQNDADTWLKERAKTALKYIDQSTALSARYCKVLLALYFTPSFQSFRRLLR
ncbi:MAG: hypothetical protein EZS28_020031 [Streblomastix strix]|uniref:UNC-45/Cro1/She4 central domain-containing protein n=1 Tax=Streblomastix strix TaxID=222440 RepID=A0A5J4VQ73_9EUKA|nr:MAG: hypothetical protein EZS28_020031 [Streblomastix strix]